MSQAMPGAPEPALNLPNGPRFAAWDTPSPAAIHAPFSRRRHERSRIDGHRWLISEAMHAAPKPLSMFTTETFGVHVFSIPSSAATPPSDAP